MSSCYPATTMAAVACGCLCSTSWIRLPRLQILVANAAQAAKVANNTSESTGEGNHFCQKVLPFVFATFSKQVKLVHVHYFRDFKDKANLGIFQIQIIDILRKAILVIFFCRLSWLLVCGCGSDVIFTYLK